MTYKTHLFFLKIVNRSIFLTLIDHSTSRYDIGHLNFYPYQVIFYPKPICKQWWYVIQVAPRSKQIYEDHELVDNDLNLNADNDVTNGMLPMETTTMDDNNVLLETNQQATQYMIIEDVDETLQYSKDEHSQEDNDHLQ